MDYLIPAEVIAAAAEAMEIEAIRCLGRDLGTVHRDDIAAATLGAALAAGLLAAPAARLPAGAASQIATAVHNTLCDCMDNHTGITLRSSDLDLVRDAVAALLESWQGASPAAPADDEAAVERMARATYENIRKGIKFAYPWDDYGESYREMYRSAARAALAALREADHG